MPPNVTLLLLRLISHLMSSNRASRAAVGRLVSLT